MLRLFESKHPDICWKTSESVAGCAHLSVATSTGAFITVPLVSSEWHCCVHLSPWQTDLVKVQLVCIVCRMDGNFKNFCVVRLELVETVASQINYLTVSILPTLTTEHEGVNSCTFFILFTSTVRSWDTNVCRVQGVWGGGGGRGELGGGELGGEREWWRQTPCWAGQRQSHGKAIVCSLCGCAFLMYLQLQIWNPRKRWIAMKYRHRGIQVQRNAKRLGRGG